MLPIVNVKVGEHPLPQQRPALWLEIRTDRGHILGVFRHPSDGVAHLAPYTPHAWPPSDTLCGMHSQYFNITHNSDVCAACVRKLEEMLELQKQDAEGATSLEKSQ